MSKSICFLIICFLLSLSNQATAQIKYVKTVASGLGDGSSWANASDSLQVMIDEAELTGKIVYVAEGVYTPVMNATTVTDTERSISFEMGYDVAIYGGFPSSGDPTFDDRDWETYTTTLSGDLLDDDGPDFTNNSDNSYHVISNSFLNDASQITKLDGFVISGGNANGPGEKSKGGGVFVTEWLRMRNCTISYNYASYGGGIANDQFFGDPLDLLNCTILGNESLMDGGGYYGTGQTTIEACLFKDNIAGGNGGGIYTQSWSTSPILNSIFIGNKANNGGGIFNFERKIEAVNCSFSGNEVTTAGGAFYGDPGASSSTLKNCILWGNSDEDYGTTTATYSIIEQTSGVYPGTGNLNTDPLFIAQPAVGQGNTGDLHLQVASPAIDVGVGDETLFLDFDRKQRNLGSGLDMGAYEEGDACPSSSVVYVDINATGANNGSSWTDAYTDLQSALLPANICKEMIQVWVAAGTYKPTSGTDRNAHFRLRNNCAVFGGFAGGEATLDQRDIATNICVLSGDLLGNDGPNFTNYTDNSLHIIRNFESRLTNTAILDGFTITGGNADGFFHPGGAMFNYNASPLVSNCIFDANSAGNSSANYFGGGGMFNLIMASPIVTNCAFSNNRSMNDGGAIFSITNSNITIDSCAFMNNTADHDGGAIQSADFGLISGINISNTTFESNIAFEDGGAIRCQGLTTVHNCVFAGNQATLNGGAIQQNFVKLLLTNSVFIGNSSTNGAIHQLITNGTEVTNCSFSGNPNSPIYLDQCFNHTLRSSILWNNNGTIQLVNGGANSQIISSNLDQVDPLFVNQPPVALGTTGDLRLQTGSPDIDTETSATDYDLDGKLRPIGPGYDKGAYEYGAECSTILATFTGAGDGVHWNDATNWDINVVPTCHSILIPTGHDVIVPNSFNAKGRSVTVESGASLLLDTVSTLEIKELFGIRVQDVDGNLYKTIEIGDQLWMAENLRTTKYNDGTLIPIVTDSAAWANLTTPAYCYFENDPLQYLNPYGALYNYYTVANTNSLNVCPIGWHVPTDAEWTVLTAHLGGDAIAGGKMKEAGTVHWNAPNTAATNESGFTALPGGFRTSSSIFAFNGRLGNWWTSTGVNGTHGSNLRIFNEFVAVYRLNSLTSTGLSVRCLKD